MQVESDNNKWKFDQYNKELSVRFLMYGAPLPKYVKREQRTDNTYYTKHGHKTSNLNLS